MKYLKSYYFRLVIFILFVALITWGLYVEAQQNLVASQTETTVQPFRWSFLPFVEPNNPIYWGIILTLALVVTFICAEWLVLRPIRKLTRTAEQIAKGDLPTHVNYAGADLELGPLAHALEQLAQILANQRANQFRVETSLRQHAQKFQGIIDHSGDGIVLTDENGIIVEWNHAQEKITGLERTKTMGRLIWDIQFQLRENKQSASEIYQQLKSDGAKLLHADGASWSNILQETAIKRLDGTLRYIQTRTFRISTPNGSMLGSISRDVTDRKHQEEQLAYLAVHDPLTGLANRRLLEENLRYAIARARRGTLSTLMLMDADRFKTINDTLGHPTGDQALIVLSQLIHKNMRTGDLLARIGGDEFAALLEGASLEQAQIIADRLLLGVRKFDFVYDKQAFKLGLSIGLTSIDGTLDPQVYLSRADTAMYRAKENGRNCVVIYDTPAPMDLSPSYTVMSKRLDD